MTFALDKFTEQIKSRKQFVDSCLDEYLHQVDAFPPLIHEAMCYAVFNGGKRLRPIMVMEGAIIAGGTRESVAPVACALEMIHSYSLVHDDLPAMDNDDFRRGKPTCHKVYGEANAILTGDALLTAAFELMTRNADINGINTKLVLKVIQEIASAAGSRGMVGGQVIDLVSEGKNIDFASLKALHSLKTGELFRVSLRAGAILHNIDEKGLQALEKYARHFGLAFQITDDILDVKGNPEFLGKPIGSDAKNHKTTYPGLFGLEKAWQLAQENVNTCIESLDGLGTEADFLRDLALFTLHRNS
ncbi:MAG: polyprenyl synthetase family protein [Syntrophomonadaceae bacterium]|nr:polyprenyl synthetase family protein [Syntrophomonadaceae bacterium]MDD3888503.1 polyprenyl synthetase family protein [Syntrophomonadaceae bacterium]MDD4548743.1 polyprenyl synthetase family protein [Syntrophomonadaceae bacterium]